MLVRLEVQIAKVPVRLFGMFGAYHPVRTGELRHQESTAALFADQPAENRVRYTRHRCENGGRIDCNRAHKIAVGEARISVLGHEKGTFRAGKCPNDTILTGRRRNSLPGTRVLVSKGIALVTSFNLVKVAAAFVAGIVVALGSALIYVRVNDPGHIPTSQTSVIVPPAPVETPAPPADTAPEAKPVSTEHKVQRRHSVLSNALAKPVRKPIQIAQNDVHPVLKMPPPEPAPTAAVQQQPPDQSAIDQPPVDQPKIDTPPVAEPAPVVV